MCVHPSGFGVWGVCLSAFVLASFKVVWLRSLLFFFLHFEGWFTIQNIILVGAPKCNLFYRLAYEC